MAVIQLQEDAVTYVACAGLGADRTPPGATRATASTVDEDILDGRVRYRPDIAERTYGEEHELLGFGLRSRVVVPLQFGARTTGVFSVSRTRVDGFTADEVELVALLGRLIASAVQNIRTFDAERAGVDELRRLSVLRADFVALVSHELRSPMASVIGAARTLQSRWPELSPEQRDAFLALVVEEASRLGNLVTDVLDASRLDGDTFSYAFSELDLGRLVEDVVATSTHGQDHVRLVAAVRRPLPVVRGDPERLRQVLTNLVDNSVKYSPAGEEVRVTAFARDNIVRVDVADNGPGIAPGDHAVIFEKFGRAGSSKPGTGLGLYIARSIAEAHGGALAVRSVPTRGATFTLELPRLREL